MRTVLDYVLEPPVHVGRDTAVHPARRLPGDERVALKLASAGLAGDEVATVQLRLRREAAALSAITHPGVVPLVEVLDLPATRGRLHRYGSEPAPPTDVAIVLRWARLGSLADALAAEPAAPVDAFTLAHQLSGALAAVHRAGFVHGDLSPGNLLRPDPSTWWLADLGDARPVGAAPRVPHRGTEGFVAPEVLAGGPVDRAADVFALGAVIRAAIGQFTSADGPGAGRLLELVRRATSSDPARRPTAAELEGDLAQLAAADRPPPPPRRPGPPRQVQVETRDLATPAAVLPAPSPVRPTARVGANRRITMMVAGGTAVTAAVLLALVLVRSASGTRTAASARSEAPTATAFDSAEPLDRAPCPGSPVATPPGAVAVPGDPDGVGCTVAVLWWPDRAEADRPDPDGTRRRFALGRPGDQLLLGDWDGDGVDTPALYDPAAGTVTRFDGWAPSGASIDGAMVTSDAPIGGLARTDRVADPDVVHVDPPADS